MEFAEMAYIWPLIEILHEIKKKRKGIDEL